MTFTRQDPTDNGNTTEEVEQTSTSALTKVRRTVRSELSTGAPRIVALVVAISTLLMVEVAVAQDGGGSGTFCNVSWMANALQNFINFAFWGGGAMMVAAYVLTSLVDLIPGLDQETRQSAAQYQSRVITGGLKIYTIPTVVSGLVFSGTLPVADCVNLVPF